MTGKGRELADMMERRKVDILCVQETRWRGSKARSIGAGFKLFYYGVDSKRNGVGVVLKEEFVRNVLEVKRVSDRVLSLKLEIEGVMLNVVSGYAPQVGCELEEKERFWSELDEVMESIPTGERVVIGADFNGHVGEGNTGDEEVMGKFGVKERNLEGQMVVDFAKRMDMGVVNTYFQKREEHRLTYKSGGRRTQVDYILCRRGNLKEISDCKVVVGESVARQHRMVVCRMTLMVCKKKRSKIEKKTKWWKLKKEECCEEFRQKLRQALGGQVVLPDDWETTAEVIRETGRKLLGVSSGRRKEDKETWWWNEEVQDSIQRKRLAKKKWDMDRTEENRQEYKELQRRVKREVSKAKQKAYDELYTRLDTREGQKDLYRLARQRDRDGKDVQQVRVIKDRYGKVLTSEESVQRRWKEYFEELMNEENEGEKRVEGVNSVEQKVDKIRKDEVRKALKRMKSGKAVGPDDIPVEVWKCLGEAAVEFLTSLFNRVLENLEKAYDRVPREELWYCMRKSGVAEKYIRVVQDMYERSRTVVRCAVGQTEEFNVEVGLHQRLALSPFLFAIVMDQLSEEVRQESPCTMMFADDIVICSESREQVEENLERWRFVLKRRGMKVSRSKTEYMCVNEREGSGTVRLQGEEVKKVQEFKYLGSTVQSNGECGKEVKKRVQAGWNGWRKVSGVLCDRKISARIKGKVYRTVVRPAMLYGLETVSLRKRQESELEVAELKMLRPVKTCLMKTTNYETKHIIPLHNIFSSLLNPPAPPSPSSLTAEDFATFYTEKIERICQTFTSLPTSPTSHSQHSATPSLTQLTTVVSEEVLQITRSCNPTTCPLDPIPSAMLQTISPDLLPFITTVINGSLMSGHVPTAFKKARVIPILRKPALDPSDISNYRPVSLLSFFSKILERVVYNQLSDYLMQNNLHDPNQSGFKAAHSTETALLAVTEKLHAARSAKLSSVLILLDLSAAFDTVNHKTLLSTLRSLGICGTAWEWFASYLDGRSYQVTWNGLTSAPRRLSTGVPQGSVLGPLLFSLYTHSLGKVISSHTFSYHCYADDTQLIFSFPPSDTTTSARISACLAAISSWMTAHQLKLNPSKTELLIIAGDPSPAQDLAISLSNSMISPSATARNLGVTMDNQLSFSSHVTNVTRSCRFLLYNIRRIRPFLSTQATQVLVQSLVISRLDNCNSLLAGLPLNAIRPLQMIQNAAARLVFNLPKFSHTTPLLPSLHWLPVAARIRFKTLMLAYKAKNRPAPSYLKALITPRTAPRSLRSTSTARLVPLSLREKGTLAHTQ
ncbi:hypothetical protein QTP70_003376 [Hemibagrus guttatus]|uniref:ribonuclease H n=1 Tax=Hemibagrus guttatus TaxID=175788 RepID=A0AAE0V2I7_9TELE|nr:hypothetical protein QTP70_003376 [Hemibagrus guttatus]